MPCPTCDHTMEGIGDAAARRIFHCPRCGTVKIETYTGDPNAWAVDVFVPKLVQRCRDFAERMPKEAAFGRWSDWHRLGIAEAIDPPARRRKGP